VFNKIEQTFAQFNFSIIDFIKNCFERKFHVFRMAQDMLQDDFLKLWKYKSHLDSIENVGAFIFKGTQNQPINYFRRLNSETLMLWKMLAGARAMTDVRKSESITK
jgi:DNA-directed RNA polymerase specialized sigma24 family protein